MYRAALVIAILALLAATACSPSPEAVKKAIRENPEIILDVLAEHKVELVELVQSGLQERKALEEEKRLQAELAAPLSPVVDPARILYGEPNAPVTIVEYTDFLCPYCSRADMVMSGILEDRPQDVNLVFKHFPLHDKSMDAALVFEALADRDKAMAWAFKKKLFAAQYDYDEQGLPVLKRILAEVGADPALVDAALADQSLKDRVAADMQEAEAFGFRGTPTFLVGGVTVEGAAPREEFERIIRLVAEKAAEECDECTKQ